MGLQAEHIVKSFVFGDGEDETKFEVILKKYDDYFVPKRNVIHERAKFHLRSQAQGESVETFIRSLHELSEHCDFANRSEAIRDRLVIGINDKGLSEKLQLTKDLTLEKASEMARNSELVKSQIRDLQSKNLDAVRVKRHTQDPPHQVNRGRGAQRTRGGQSSRGRGSNNQNRQNANLPLCGACNRKHYEGQCPAHGRRCRKCNRRNHFAVCCRSNTVAGVREIVDDDNDHHDYFLGSVTACNEGEPWFVKLKVCGSEIPFKIDTGADISIMSEYTYKSLPFQPKLHVNNSKLQTPNGDLHSLGKFKVTTRHKNHPYSFHVVVIPSTDSQNNLLSRSVASTMGLIQKIGSVIEHHGTMKGDPVKIVLRSDAQPYCVTTARRIPFALMPKVKAELDKLENDGIIRKINEPTDWCAPIVPATKKNGDVRICIDLKRLNEAVKREYYMLPNLDDISPKLSEATIFSKLDAASGFHQLKLHEDSQKLTTFITPFGRYCYTRVPFGISSAPEIFQRRMGEVLSGLEGVESIIDDVIIYGSSRNEHDRRLKAALDRIRDAGIKLNPNKCEYRKEKIEYFGHIISKDGVQPSPERVRSILDLPPPTNISELRRIIGMINYLGRFVPDLSSIMNPINNLLKSDTAWTWDESQQSAFDRVKKLITEAPVLAFYDMTRPTIVSADASSFGIGAALFQVVDGETKPIAFASRTLTEAERKYAQIEKECLAGVWACEKFDRYLMGIGSFELITDHKPLVPLINTQDLNKAPLRCQRLLMRLRRYNVVAKHVPGKQLVVPDTLSRSPLNISDQSNTVEDVTAYVASVVNTKPLSDKKLEEIRNETSSDPILPDVMRYTMQGWPQKENSLYAELKPYFAPRFEFSVSDGILFYRDRLVIPESLRADVLAAIHTGHLGLNKSRERAKSSVWWPGLSSDLEHLIRCCEFCNTNRPSQRSEPLKTTQLPSRPWVRVGADLCELQGKNYLVVMDYFSRYLEIAYLDNITSNHVVGKLKNMFARWGIPEELVSDNGGQFSSKSFRQFSIDYGFHHTFSSPHYPQANGEAESAVKVAKRILKQPDVFLALMAYRSTPVHATGTSPSELIMGRKIRTTVPICSDQLEPGWPDLGKVREKDRQSKHRMRVNFNRMHGARTLKPLYVGDRVRVKTDKEKSWDEAGIVTSADYANRSYFVKTLSGDLRRNRKHLLHVNDEMQDSSVPSDFQCSSAMEPEPEIPMGNQNSEESLCTETTTPLTNETPSVPVTNIPQSSTPPATVRRSGREIKRPKYLSDYLL